eukprot:5440260-Pleurochrysis_carterae.AAC.1
MRRWRTQDDMRASSVQTSRMQRERRAAGTIGRKVRAVKRVYREQSCRLAVRATAPPTREGPHPSLSL